MGQIALLRTLRGNLITMTSRKIGYARLLRRDKRLPRRIGTARLVDHRRRFRLIAARFSEQSVVEVRQAVLCDWTSMNDMESNADDARITRRQGNELPNNVSAVGKDLPVFVDTLHAQTFHVLVSVERIDRIVASDHGGIEGVDPPYSRV